MLESKPDPFDPRRGEISARPVHPSPYPAIALKSLIFLIVELFLGLQLGFVPGWANGWLGGRLSIQEVWSVGIASILFAILLTGSIGLGALLALLLGRMGIRRRYVERVFGVWVIVWTILSFASAIPIRQSIFESALEMWPNGYNP